MSGDIVNLRRVRKDKARAAKGEVAAANRALHGRTRTEREIESLERRRAAHHLEGHRRGDCAGPDDGAAR